MTAESPLLDERKITTGATITEIGAREDPDGARPVVAAQPDPRRADRPDQRRRQRERPAVGVRLARIATRTTRPGRWTASTSPTWRRSPRRPTSTSTPSRSCSSSPAARTSAKESSGVTVNVVTKRGTNEWRGTGRYFLTDGDWQSDPDVDDGDAGVNGPGGRRAGPRDLHSQLRSTRVKEYGARARRPDPPRPAVDLGRLRQERSDRQHRRRRPARHHRSREPQRQAQRPDRRASNSANVQYSENDKIKDGRGAGATRAPETTTDQTGVGGDRAPS